jgi:hypothetical protein
VVAVGALTEYAAAEVAMERRASESCISEGWFEKRGYVSEKRGERGALVGGGVLGGESKVVGDRIDGALRPKLCLAGRARGGGDTAGNGQLPPVLNPLMPAR